MSERKVGVANVSPRHPRGGGPSTIEIALDTGLKSGKLSIGELSIDEALDLANALLSTAIIVKDANARKEVTG